MTKLVLAFLTFIFFNIVSADDLKNFSNRLPLPGVANNGLGKGDWPVFHGSYMGYSYSALDSINTSTEEYHRIYVHEPFVASPQALSPTIAQKKVSEAAGRCRKLLARWVRQETGWSLTRTHEPRSGKAPGSFKGVAGA